ncbi:MAG: hypothetical protein RR135_06700 [Oscillospiraceae bacterium]
MESNTGMATSMTMAAIIMGLAVTEDMSAIDQTAIANLLFAAAQAISTRASLMPSDPVSEPKPSR